MKMHQLSQVFPAFLNSGPKMSRVITHFFSDSDSFNFEVEPRSHVALV